MAERHIVIVGGGFTGTATAIHLAGLGDAGLTVTVIEPRPQLACGVAYGTRDPAPVSYTHLTLPTTPYV